MKSRRIVWTCILGTLTLAAPVKAQFKDEDVQAAQEVVKAAQELPLESFPMAAATPANVEIFVHATKCEEAKGSEMISSWQAGESWIVRASDFADGKVKRTTEGAKGTITVTMSVVKADQNQNGRMTVKARFSPKDKEASGTAVAKLIADFGSISLASAGACDTASDVGMVTMHISISPKN